MAGIAVGNVIGGKLIQNGKRRVMIICNLFVIIASVMTLFQNWQLMFCGRILMGFASGVTITANQKMLEQTVPQNVIDFGFSASTNTVINFAVMSTMLLGIGYPTDPVLL